MPREEIKFQNDQAIYFEPNLNDLLGSRNFNGSLKSIFKEWRKNNIKSIYIFPESEISSATVKIAGFKKAAEKAGFEIHSVSLQLIKDSRIDYYLQLNHSVKNLLKSSSGIFLHSPANSADVRAYAAILLISLRPPGDLATPEGAIQFVSDRDALQREDLRVFKFKQYIDKSYAIPEKVLDYFRTLDKRVESESPVESKDTTPVESLDFIASRFFTIRNKLLLIISGVIVIALSVMIFLASLFFRDNVKSRIEEFSLKSTNLIGENIESKFRDLSILSLNRAAQILQSSDSPEAAGLSHLFFRNNKQFIFIGIADQKNNRLEFSRRTYNDKFLEESQITRGKLDAISERFSAEFLKAQSGAPVILNVSPGLPVPILSLSLPFGEGINRHYAIIYIDPEKFLKAFKTSGIIQTFMVNGEGNIIAHGDSKMVLAAARMGDLPIVKKMLVSAADNGKIEYDDSAGIAYIGMFKKLGFANLGVVSIIEKDKAFKTVDDIQIRNIYILIIVLFVAVFIVFFFARTLSVPIVKLVSSSRQVARGDYDVKIRPTTHDEIGSLTHSFSSMTVGLAEREKMKDAFGKFVNKEIAERVLRGDVKLGGEKKECAIFFSDLRGFTAMSEKMAPEEVVEYLNEYFTAMVECINDTHGIVDKYIGDAIMAHWGAMDTYGNNTENAVNASLAMRIALIKFNENASAKHPFAKFGCGMNTGPVISGQIGSSVRLEYTIIGDAVNLASRVETLNKPFGTDILISQDSYDHVKDIFNVEIMPAIKVKGKTEPQIIYAVLGHKGDPDCPANMDAVRRMTGTDAPKVNLKNFDDAKEDKFEVVQG